MGAQKGYRVILVVPDNYSSPFRLRVLALRGAQVVTSDHREGNDSHIRLAKSLVENNPGYVCLDQFANPANPQVHYECTGAELVKDLPRIDCFVAGIGSGGTITGVGRRLREAYPGVRIVGVQPEGCDSLHGKAITHRIQGLAVGRVPSILDTELIDEMQSVSFEEVVSTIRALARQEGLFVGLSSGANLAVAVRLARRLGPGKTVATVSPDSGKNYPDLVTSDFEP